MDDHWRVNLIGCTDTICNAVARGMKQADIAVYYAASIKSEHEEADTPDWPVINRAILGRWKMSGLERIKKHAWDILRGRAARIERGEDA